MSANYSVQLPDPWGGGGLGVRNWPHGSSANLSESRVWKPTLTSLWAKPRSGSADTFEAILVQMRMPEAAATQYGCPRILWLSISAPSPTLLNVTLLPFDKRGTRLPEALWIGFSPLVPGRSPDWVLDKMGTEINFAETVKNGSRYLHGIGAGVSLQSSSARQLFGIRSLDAALVAPRPQPRLPNFESGDADGSGGVAFNLLNNMWLTNYILWYPWHQQEKGGPEEMLTLPVYRFLLEL